MAPSSWPIVTPAFHSGYILDSARLLPIGCNEYVTFTSHTAIKIEGLQGAGRSQHFCAGGHRLAEPSSHRGSTW